MADLLTTVEQSLRHFVPKNGREYTALQIARRFHDTPRLAKYLLIAREYPKRLMLEAARRAMLHHEINRTPAGELFFEVITAIDEGRTP